MLLLGAQAHAQTPAAPQQQQLNTTLQNLAKTRETESQLKKRLEATEREIATMRQQATDLAERLQTSEKRVSAQEDALAQANKEYAEKRREFEDRKADYTATVLSLLRMRNLPTAAMITSSEDTQTLLRTASALEKTNEVVAAKAAALREDMARIKRLQKDVKQRDVSTRNERAKLERERQKLADALVARQKLQDQLSIDHTRAEEKVAELSRASKSLQELISKLAENQKAQLKIEPAIKKTPLRDFGDKKNSMRAPVAGQVIHRFGDKQGANSTYRGMVFKARPGATVVAPYDGEVAFTGPFRDYGNMVLIKHKNGFISLIAGLGKVSASLNQTALRGEPIGTMPETGTGEAYMELRDSDAKPIDPTDWIANVVAKMHP